MNRILRERSGGYYYGGYDRRYRPYQWCYSASCADMLDAAQSVLACVMEKGGLATNGTVNRAALERAIKMRGNSAKVEAIAEQCSQPKDSADLIACWTTKM